MLRLLRRHQSEMVLPEDQELMEDQNEDEQALLDKIRDDGIGLPSPGTCPKAVDTYLEECRKYGTEPNSGVLVALRFRLNALRPTRPFHCKDMIPLAEVLMRHAEEVTHIRDADFSQARMRSHGAIVLSKVLQHTHWESLQLRHNPIGGYGASAIASALSKNKTIRHVGLRCCCAGQMGADSIASLVLEHGMSRVEDIDMSVNQTGLKGAIRIKAALALTKNKIDVRMDNNVVLAEIGNSATHGIGIILSVVGFFMLMERANAQSSQHRWAATVYACSLVALYTCSTLYHSFYFLLRTKEILHLLDQCAIYILIAGSYTPILAVTLYAIPLYSTWLLGFMWLLCVLGVNLTVFYNGRHKGMLSLTFYLLMGWAALVCIGDIARLLSAQGLFWLVAGGVLYTAGVPFFAMDRDPATSWFHVVWHLFVMAGSGAHFWMIYQHVMPIPLPLEGA